VRQHRGDDAERRAVELEHRHRLPGHDQRVRAGTGVDVPRASSSAEVLDTGRIFSTIFNVSPLSGVTSLAASPSITSRYAKLAPIVAGPMLPCLPTCLC